MTMLLLVTPYFIKRYKQDIMRTFHTYIKRTANLSVLQQLILSVFQV